MNFGRYGDSTRIRKAALIALFKIISTFAYFTNSETFIKSYKNLGQA